MMSRKILLSESDLPKFWYNIAADMPELPPPPLHPATGNPLTPDDLAPLFPMGLIEQEMSAERWIEIPKEVREAYLLWRPTPLHRAVRLEKALDTPAKIFYKNESYSPPGSHKPNTAIAQAFYNKIEGARRLTTETGAGQWGSALSFACNYFGLGCTVYMVKVSYQQKPYRRIMMQTWGAEVIPSPSDRTESGRRILEQDPDSPGSLGIAISEAVEDAVKHEDAHYTLGSVLNHVLLHQTIVGLEAKRQMEIAGYEPDILIGCVGGGSNFAGFSFPFLADKLKGKSDVRVIAVEPTACPTLTKGLYEYDFGDTAGLTPLVKMYTLGHSFVPPKIHAGGLRYHGDAPLMCKLVKDGYIEARAYHQNTVFEAAVLFARAEGFVPAPETAHAVKAVIDEAIKAREEGKEKVIVFNFSGHGHFDLAAYDAYFSGELEDYEYPEELIRQALGELPKA
ncbi:TPA: TrpB-like pyridoxal phosphate-dependent enzyme [Candidatus Poribacteria bacterium]|nr:TrpB-like pyridoxal phosphate-dependent enzyme [Candidatus Poribacteria bacterium]HEX30417.1 TrpB-like pyridoxal phosphate-dependent enzyme [Candidatus Poribacteria bacterium]